MRRLLFALTILIAGPAGCHSGAPPAENVRYSEFVPTAGHGPVVVVLSGRAGPDAYSFIPRALVGMGYYVVLFAGPDFPVTDPKAGENLRRLIQLVQHAPHANPGKVAVLGASAGGGAAVTFATSLSDLVSVVVAYYPATRSIPDKTSVTDRWSVPTLVLAGDADNNGCCMIGTITAMVAAAKDRGAPVELVTYAGADHDFILAYHYKPDAATDSWHRTLAALHQHLGP